MKVNFDNDKQIVEEVFNILSHELDINKLVRFWTICKFHPNDYSELKEQLFGEETVDSLYEKIKNFEDN